jgi:hypothetical protein
MNLEEQIKAQIEREVLQKELGLQQFQRQLESRKLGKDYSRSTAGEVISTNLMGLVIDQVEIAMEATLDRAGINSQEIGEVYSRLKAVPKIDLDSGAKTGETVNPWDHRQAALIAFRTMLDVVQMPIHAIEEGHRGRRFAGRPTLYQLHLDIGKRLETQLILNLLRLYFPDSNHRVGFISRMLKETYSRQASSDQKNTTTRLKLNRLADWYEDECQKTELAELFRWKPWDNRFRRIIGAKLVAIVQSSCWLGEGIRVFKETAGAGGIYYLDLTLDGHMFANALEKEAGAKAFVSLPMLCPPKPHSSVSKGGYLNVGRPEVEHPASGAFKGRLELSDAHLEFLNIQAAVPLRINQFILKTMEGIYGLRGEGRNIGKFVPKPFKEDYVEEMPAHLASRPSTDPEKRRFREAIKGQYKAFLQLDQKAKGYRTEDLLWIAQHCRHDERLWLPTSGDFRGRTYVSGCLLNYQGTDASKALLEFADGVEADERTEWWLIMEMAACMGFDKLSFKERERRVAEAFVDIIESVKDPIDWDWWKEQDKPWSLLAAAQEWVRLFVEYNSDRRTHARVSVDATCSGQQFMAGWTRSLKTAQQVNLVPAEAPTDVYANVLNATVESLNAIDYRVPLKEGQIAKTKLKALGSKDPIKRSKARAGTKGVVMVGQYGAGKTKRIEEFAERCKLPWLSDGSFSIEEAKALYPHIQQGLDICLEALDPFLSWCQNIASAALSNGLEGELDPLTGKPRNRIYLPSADGSVSVQRYPKTALMKIHLDHLGSLILKGKRRDEVDQHPTQEADISKHVSSVAANFVHANDGAALVLGLSKHPFPFTTCHDSIAGRPGKEMDQLQMAMRRALYSVFTSDICTQFVELNGLKVEDHPLPNFQTYDPQEVLSATYAYC